MGKIVRLFIICILSFSVAFASANSDLRKFDLNYKSATHNEMVKYHSMLKGVYIKSIMNNDKRLKIKALKRLVISSQKLNLSPKAYQKELRTLQGKSNKIKITKHKKSSKKFITPIKGSNAKILKVKSSLNGVSLIFNGMVKDIDVRTFALKGSRSYRYVFDVGAVLTVKSQTIRVKNMQRVRISQYNKKTVRVVFESSKRIKLYHTKIDNTINIGYKGLKSSSAKSTYKKNSHNNISSKTKPTRFKPSKKIIVIDAGHGGKDGGAQGARGRSEKKIVLQTALRLGRELKARGFKVYYTRVRDKFITLRNRTKMANRKNADLFVSIHANAAPNRSKYKSMYGAETFFLSPARSKRSKNVAATENKSDLKTMNYFSKQTYLNFLNREKILAANKLAIDVQQGMLNSIRKRYKVRDGGVREAPFWVLVGAQMPAILVEIGYITNPVEGKRIASSSYQNLIANGIANGIVSYFDKNR